MDVKELEAVAARELAKHGLQGWTFALGTTKRRLGVCKYVQRRIEIAEYFARNSPAAEVFDTLLHEIAHALAGHAAAHGPAWKKIAVRLGATPRACTHSKQAIVMPGDWQSTCPSCGKTYHIYKRPRSLTGYRCRCAARTDLVLKYTGDLPSEPYVPMTRQESARWEAKCAGCGVVHLRHRRPRAGIWSCRCPGHCTLLWRPRSSQARPT